MRRLVASVLLSACMVSSAALAEQQAWLEISYSRVENHPLFGGLGGGSGPIGALTDFYVDEAENPSKPVLSISGEHADAFEASGKKAYVYIDGSDAVVCPKKNANWLTRKLKCYEYREYSSPEAHVQKLNEIKRIAATQGAQPSTISGTP